MPICLEQFKSGAYSQHGEEGVIEAIFREIGVKSKTCVEFGAYELRRLSNVYSLWTNGWRALLIEGDREQYAGLTRDYAAHPQAGEQRVRIANRFVAEDGPDSLDCILSEYKFPTDLDLVSMDVDGIEFHIWRGLRKFQPRLVIVEYNPTIPPHIEIVASGRGNNIGCSALALAKLGQEKGYSLVACIGWNAFFVRTGDAHLFADVDDLDALFDPSYLRYAMQSYSGEVFFSAPLHLKYEPFRRDSLAIETSSVELGRLGDTLERIRKQVLSHYLHTARRSCVAALERSLPSQAVNWLRAGKRYCVQAMRKGS